MIIMIQHDFDDLSKAVAEYIIQYVKEKPNALLCFPSGESPTGVLRYLVQAVRAGQVDVSQCTLIGLDEWVGLDESNEGSCRYFLQQNLFDPLDLAPEKVMVFNGKAADLDQECQRVNTFIQQNGPLDIMLVGIGLNGHIGLNEPGTSFDLYAHHAPLAEMTITVGQKYFKQPTPLTNGITLGLKHFQEARIPILIAAGGKKASIIAQSLEGEVTNQVPASILQTLPDALVYLDRAAAAELQFAPAS
ncbi:glucosamine-6-phosphate deaminase [Adhaeribacter pallidiroseus]|uniref:Glucosamine-6-phosphate deaminase n=1 Tax=Adhaeribacter pallidiroseus TaxID=2072847 RepID=A0A369QML5_9BACT|nr:glucosamine-6-phosphate deaminase [Adhaeribacter pallidiroseus]RDC64895.1 Glucosamine-6-phosphate deaminase [Adhaeribacter pallidiroseus]